MSDSDEAYRAIGRFAYEFSRMTWHMRWQLAQITLREVPQQARGEHTFSAVQLHTGEIGAAMLSDTFFGVAEMMCGYDVDEARMATWLRKQLTPWITMRNDFFHGEWLIGWVSGGSMVLGGDSPGLRDATPIPPTLTRSKAGRSGGDKIRPMKFTVEELEAKADEFQDLRRMIADWGWIASGSAFSWKAAGELTQPTDHPGVATVSLEALPAVRHRDVYVIRDKVPVREGPLASEIGTYRFE